MHKVLVQEPPFSQDDEYRHLKSASLNVGGVATFVGTVRDINENDEVSALRLEHYPGMTEKEIHKILDEAAERWDVIAATVIHRIGDLHPGDEIVFAGVASQHRGDAFRACEFIMDFLKTRATFWKKESTADGDRWLTTRQSDVEAAATWEKD
ncbi:MAG: molybdopterin synthase catalytic subunit MoaE [Gammaproteobacteria bacterium]|jgi:molybdopterin synthase catalytic subunit|nr:molybdopterin synthase catalytic subunit MoaE [Gammaproteobacteria bacterium]MBT7370560.1 molybdopterin synthase catalytic subunit MoaE [Gammaproteobacteria bacterium]